ncbi:hypothetical protein POL68_37240 [Stigmatella sp. ncwal1]|uniref:YCII-related domain-containing protein n=1 Tax=Stigmatella ashevillensis TaxID=2995309 RepID=A0ABT5DKW2_9BACT|nr:hypothetical protein [Stigmatella ashevillena]MDC0714171.1 hypothetical protein [Stigmatella ashevillena]
MRPRFDMGEPLTHKRKGRRTHEHGAKDEEGLAALRAWDAKHRDVIVYEGGPLGKTKRTSPDGVADVVNELTVFVVVRAPSHEAAAKLFENHPHFTIFSCDAVDVMPLLSGPPEAEARAPSPGRRGAVKHR